jgi:hypothetical protein
MPSMFVFGQKRGRLGHEVVAKRRSYGGCAGPAARHHSTLLFGQATLRPRLRAYRETREGGGRARDVARRCYSEVHRGSDISHKFMHIIIFPVVSTKLMLHPKRNNIRFCILPSFIYSVHVFAFILY